MDTIKRTERTFFIHQFLQLHDQFLILTNVFKELLDIPISAASLAPDPVREELTESDSDPESLDNDNDIDYHECSSEPNRFKQDDLSDVMRDLNLPKESTELLASCLKERNFQQAKTNVTSCRNREANFLPYFKQYEEIVVCNNAEPLLMELDIVHYEANSWRLFTDGSKRSLKCVLLHNTNEYASIPIGHSTTLKEKYGPVKQVLECIKYSQQNWKIYVDLKMLNFLLGQQSGYTKHPCFLCMWDSHDKANHWTKEDWEPRITLRAGDKNIINEPLVPRDRIILPPLHIKLGLIKQLVKALGKDSECFKYICRSFPGLSIEKLKAEIFDEPGIRKLVQDENFILSMNPLEADAWWGFVGVAENFLGNRRAANFEEVIQIMLDAYERLGANMSIKVHFLHKHLDRFSANCGNVSDEQGEHFHQDIKEMETRYQGRWDARMMADYCWSIKHDNPTANYLRQSRKRKFLPKHSSSFME